MDIYTAVAYCPHTGMALKQKNKAFYMSRSGDVQEMFSSFAESAISKAHYIEIKPVSGNLEDVFELFNRLEQHIRAKQRGMAKSEGLAKGARGDWRNEGYFFNVVHHEDHPKFGGEAVEVQAHHPQYGNVGGTLVRVGEQGYWSPSMTEVLPKHRRKGLASEMYRLAEERLGEKVIPDSHQTSHAKKLWKQPNRPFGMEVEDTEDW